MEIKMDLISEDKINSMSSTEKLRFLLDGVKAGNIVILEGGLTTEEQMQLIELTMTEVDDDFPGIELNGYPSKKTRLTMIGPAKMMRTIKKDKDLISTVVSAV
jgi:hypothetical protein